MKHLLAFSVLEFIVNVIICGVLLALLGQFLLLTTYEQILIGAVSFLAILAIQISYRLSHVAKLAEQTLAERTAMLESLKRMNQLSNTRETLERLSPHLRKISDGIETLTERYGSQDLFITWYLRKIELLQKHIQQTVDANSYYFDEMTLRERPRIFDILRKQPPSYFWAVCITSSIPHFEDTDGAAALREEDKRFQNGELASIRRLFVYDNESELRTIEAKLLLYLHDISGYEYRVINASDFDSIRRNFSDKTMMRDFGVWGSSFVWETSDSDSLTAMGNMCRDQTRVRLYTQLYEELWVAASTLKIEDAMVIRISTNQRIGQFREILAILRNEYSVR